MNLGKLKLWAMFVLFNLSGFGLLALALMKGWVMLVIERDTSRICLVIAGVFLVGLVLAYIRVSQLNRLFDQLESGDGDVGLYRAMAKVNAGNANEVLKVRLGRKLMWLHSVLYLLPGLGLFGTVVGIAMGLEGMVVTDAGQISDKVDSIFFNLTGGLAVAFYTTIVGMIFMFWIYLVLRMLETASMRFIEAVLESANVPAGVVVEGTSDGRCPILDANKPS